MKYPTIQNRDGADAETVVCALFHDVGEVLNHVNHGEIGFCNHDDCEEEDDEDEEDGDDDCDGIFDIVCKHTRCKDRVVNNQ